MARIKVDIEIQNSSYDFAAQRVIPIPPTEFHVEYEFTESGSMGPVVTTDQAIRILDRLGVPTYGGKINGTKD